MTKILVVDDDEDILMALQFFLKRNRFEVAALSNAGMVMDTVQNMQPDIILMDINLNGHDGRQICRRLRDDNHLTIPIILFSAVPEYQNTVSEYGATGFIDKPFEVKQFINKLHSYLN
jgi:two-component system alkaline phosphatase synthesis response regulator PhoP